MVRQRGSQNEGLRRDNLAEAMQAKVLTADEARRVAMNIARLPPPSRLELLLFWTAGFVIAILSGAVAIYVINFHP
jgi:hypothetical protein